MTDYVALAQEALTRPSDFGWWGFDEMFDTWGFAGISKHDASDILEISNYHSAIADLKHKFGDDYDEHFTEVGFRHWAVNHADQLTCQILKTSVPHDKITDDDITIFFKEAVDIAISIREEYPVWDECDYSDRQWEAASDWLKQLITNRCSWFPLGGHVKIEDDTVGEIHYWLANNSDYENYLDDGTPCYEEDMIVEAVYMLGFDKLDDDDDVKFWSEWELNNPSLVIQRYNSRWEMAGQTKLF